LNEKQFIIKYMTELINTLKGEKSYLKESDLHSVAKVKQDDIEKLKKCIAILTTD